LFHAVIISLSGTKVGLAAHKSEVYITAATQFKRSTETFSNASRGSLAWLKENKILPLLIKQHAITRWR
jgi:hypothetical protein